MSDHDVDVDDALAARLDLETSAPAPMHAPHGERLDSVEDRLGSVETRLDRLLGSVSTLTEHVVTIAEQGKQRRVGMTDLERRIEALEHHVRR